MLLDDLVRDGKPETGAFAGLLRGEERVEDLRQHLGRNAGAVVFHFDRDAAAFVARDVSVMSPAAAQARLRGVGDEIEKDLIDLGRRAADGRDFAEFALALRPT